MSDDCDDGSRTCDNPTGERFGVRREEEETAHSYSEEKKKKDVRSRGEKARWLRNNNVTFAASTNDLARSH